MAKKTSANMGLYLVKPEVKPGVVWPSTPKDAKPTESQYAYFARKYMAASIMYIAVAYHKLIMAHIDEKNPLKDISLLENRATPR